MTDVAVISADRTLTVHSMPAPALAPGEVRVDVAYCGICGSDLHLMFDPPEPMVGHVLGHEFSGVIGAVGDGVDGWRVGDRVVVLPTIPCGSCRACTGGDTEAICLGGVMAGPGLGRTGGLAGEVAVPASLLHRVPDGVTLRDAALTEPLAVAMRAVARAEVGSDDVVVVAGAGPIGLLAISALRANGIDSVVVSEPNPERRGQAASLGVRACAPDDVGTVLADLDDPAPHAFIDCSGHPDVPQQALGLLGYGGRLVIVGIPMQPSTVLLLGVPLGELKIIGSNAYSPRDFAAALDAIAGGRVDTDALITSVVDLAQAGAKIAELHSGTSRDVKVLIEHR